MPNISLQRLGDIADVNWGDTKTTKASYVAEGFPAYSASGPDGYLPCAAFDRTGVVLSAIGANCGQTWLARGRWSCIKNTIRFWSTSPGVDTRYLYWVTRQPSVWPKRGSAQPFISQGDARDIRVPVPPLEQQVAIADLLGALDDKIELNRRMNETLEAMARATFRDWFVDFGPTRAKMAGSAPYLAPDLWALFPTRLDDEGKPAGWRSWTLSDLVSIEKGSVNPQANPDQMFEHYSIPAYDTGSEPKLELGISIKSNKVRVPAEGVLLSKLNPEISRVWLPYTSSGVPQVASTEFLAFRATPPSSRSLLYCLFRSEIFQQTLEGMVTGTSKSHQRVNPTAMLRVRTLVGEAAAFDAFTSTVQPMLDLQLANRAEARTLAQTRDLLLPKLMSGEIRLKAAERVLEDAA